MFICFNVRELRSFNLRKSRAALASRVTLKEAIVHRKDEIVGASNEKRLETSFAHRDDDGDADTDTGSNALARAVGKLFIKRFKGSSDATPATEENQQSDHSMTGVEVDAMPPSVPEVRAPEPIFLGSSSLGRSNTYMSGKTIAPSLLSSKDSPSLAPTVHWDLGESSSSKGSVDEHGYHHGSS